MESQVILHNESNESEYDNIESQVSLHDESMEVDNANVKHMVYCFEWNNKSLLKSYNYIQNFIRLNKEDIRYDNDSLDCFYIIKNLDLIEYIPHKIYIIFDLNEPLNLKFNFIRFSTVNQFKDNLRNLKTIVKNTIVIIESLHVSGIPNIFLTDHNLDIKFNICYVDRAFKLSKDSLELILSKLNVTLIFPQNNNEVINKHTSINDISQELIEQSISARQLSDAKSNEVKQRWIQIRLNNIHKPKIAKPKIVKRRYYNITNLLTRINHIFKDNRMIDCIRGNRLRRFLRGINLIPPNELQELFSNKLTVNINN